MRLFKGAVDSSCLTHSGDYQGFVAPNSGGQRDQIDTTRPEIEFRLSDLTFDERLVVHRVGKAPHVLSVWSLLGVQAMSSLLRFFLGGACHADASK